MKKLLLALPLVAGASWAGSSYYIGTQTEEAYDQLLTQLNDLKPLALDNASYSSGLSNSVAITNVRASTAENAPVLFQLHHDINHSPVGYGDSGVRIGAANIVTTLMTDNLSADAQEFLTRFNGGEPGQMVTDVDFNGTATSVMSLNPLHTFADDFELVYTGGQVSMVDASGNLTFNGNIGGFNATSMDGSIASLDSVVIDSQLTRVADGVYTGTTELSASGSQFYEPSMGMKVTAGSLKLTSDSQVSGDIFSANAKLSASDLTLPVDLIHTSLEVDMGGLSLESLSRFAEIQNRYTFANGSVPEQEIVDAMIEAYKDLLKPGTSIDYKLHAKNTGGEVRINTGASVLPGEDILQKVSMRPTMTMRELLESLELKLEFSADATALQQWSAEHFAQNFMLQPYIIYDGMTYKSNIVVRDSLLDANGNTQSLDMLLGPMLDMQLGDR